MGEPNRVSERKNDNGGPATESSPGDRRGEFIPETPSDITMEGNESREAREGVEEADDVTEGIENTGDDPTRRELFSPDDRFRESPLGDERLER